MIVIQTTDKKFYFYFEPMKLGETNPGTQYVHSLPELKAAGFVYR